MQYAVITVSVDVHVPKARKEKLATPINHLDFLRWQAFLILAGSDGGNSVTLD